MYHFIRYLMILWSFYFKTIHGTKQCGSILQGPGGLKIKVVFNRIKWPWIQGGLKINCCK